jgi:hypothetical protein
MTKSTTMVNDAGEMFEFPADVKRNLRALVADLIERAPSAKIIQGTLNDESGNPAEHLYLVVGTEGVCLAVRKIDDGATMFVIFKDWGAQIAHVELSTKQVINARLVRNDAFRLWGHLGAYMGAGYPRRGMNEALSIVSAADRALTHVVDAPVVFQWKAPPDELGILQVAIVGGDDANG